MFVLLAGLATLPALGDLELYPARRHHRLHMTMRRELGPEPGVWRYFQLRSHAGFGLGVYVYAVGAKALGVPTVFAMALAAWSPR